MSEAETDKLGSQGVHLACEARALSVCKYLGRFREKSHELSKCRYISFFDRNIDFGQVLTKIRNPREISRFFRFANFLHRELIKMIFFPLCK